VLDLLDTCFDH